MDFRNKWDQTGHTEKRIRSRRKRHLRRFMAVMLASVVVFTTVYALILNAIAVDNPDDVAGLALESGETAEVSGLYLESPGAPAETAETAEPAPAVSETEPAPEATDSVPEAAEPVPEMTDPVPEDINPAPEVTDPAPENTNPVEEMTDPAPELRESAPEDTAPVPEGTENTAEITDSAAGETASETEAEPSSETLFAAPEEEQLPAESEGQQTEDTEAVPPEESGTDETPAESAVSESEVIETVLPESEETETAPPESPDAVQLPPESEESEAAPEEDPETETVLSDSEDPESETETDTEEETETSPEESDESSTEDESETSEPAYEDRTLICEGPDYRITVDLPAAAKIPAEAVLGAAEIDPETPEYAEYLAQAREALHLEEDEAVPSYAARFFDIRILEGDEEIEPDPEAQIKVAIELLDAAIKTTEDLQVVHEVEEGVLETPEVTTDLVKAEDLSDSGIVIEAEEGEEVGVRASFETGSFSVYGVVYTVDFHYEANGKTYDFSIPGGGFLSLRQLVTILEIAEAKEGEEEADAAKRFVADVADAEFSSPELLWVGKAETDTSLGALKDANALEITYSAELTEDQIAEINAQTVEAGDWALIPLRAFDTEESLTVTMVNGDQFVVKVTDALIQKTVIDARGDAWEITVTFDESAEIPEGARLEVREILPEDEEYEEYYQQSLEKSGAVNYVLEQENKSSEITADLTEQRSFAWEEQTAAQISEYSRIFDIRILADDQEIQPKCPVLVSIKLLDAPEEGEAEPKVVHFAEDGTELIDIAEMTEDNDDSCVRFITDGFSVYSVVYTIDFVFDIDGKEYAFSLEGGDSTSFKEIIDRFEIFDKENAELFISNIASVEFSSPEYLWSGKLEEDCFAGDLKEKYQLDIQYAEDTRPGNILAMNAHHYSALDWVLIALKPFVTEETLTITMKNGEVFTVKVTDAQSDAFHNLDGTVQTIPNPQGTTFELFNYYVNEGTKTTAGRDQWPGHIHHDTDFWMFNWYDLNGNYMCDWGEGYNRGYDKNNNYLLGAGNNQGINAGHMLKFSPANAGTVIDGTKGTATSDVDGGSGLNGWTTDADPNQGIVQGTLADGYPKLTTDGNLGTNGESLAYLFDSSAQNGKESKGNVNHLLYVDPDGYYTYDSRDFKAEYQDDGTFKVSDQPDTTDTEVKGFWPFGTLVYWCGLHMNTQFSMPEEGKVLNPKDELKDMQFEFSGDDDTWLYIDGVLVGDGGGIHNRTEIDINFASGTVTTTGKKDTVHTGTFEETKYLDDIFRAAGKYNDADWEDIGDGSGHKRFKAGTYHTFDMFYLERGGGESNLYIHYNLVSTDDFTGHKAFEGFAENERMVRDQFRFEMIGLDGQYQSVWNSETQTADVSLVNPNGKAIMPIRGSESGEGTFADPKKVYSSSAYIDSSGQTHGGTALTTGVLENGDIRFGTADIDAAEMLACDQGHPSLYRYIIRELVPDDAVNEDGISWADADEQTRKAGGFVKDQILYDGEVYYMTARVTSWDQTGADGQTYKAYGLSKTYYTDDTFTVVANDVNFVDFRNIYAPDSGEVEFLKLDETGRPLPGAEFTLYTDSACTNVAKDLGNTAAGIAGEDQVKTSGEDGIIRFQNMAAPRTYYMKETKVPSGYETNNTTYRVIIESSRDSTKQSRIIADGDETETPVTKIYNTKPGEISVVKEWQDQNGNAVVGGNWKARVKIQRKRYQQDASSSSHNVNFTIQIAGRPDLVYTYSAPNVVGNTVTVDWWDTNQEFNSISVNDSGGNTKEYKQSNYWDDVNHKNRKLTVNEVSSDLNIVVTYPGNVNWLFFSEHTPWMQNVSIDGSGPSYETVPDTEFNSSSDPAHFSELASPEWSKTWTIGAGKDFPASDGTHPYLYYVIEVDEEGNEIQAEEMTESGYKLIGYSSNNSEGIVDQGVITVYNQLGPPEPAEITIRKYDKNDLENETAETLKGATFRLEKYTSEAYQGKDTDWNEPTVSDDGSGVFRFSGLTEGYYKIVEVTTPPGYVRVSSDPVFQVVLNDSNELEIVFTDSELVKYTADGGFRFGNTPGAVLPNTGGRGKGLLVILGSMIVIMAGMTLLLYRRKEILKRFSAVCLRRRRRQRRRAGPVPPEEGGDDLCF